MNGNHDQEWFEQYFSRYGGRLRICQVCGAAVGEHYRELHALFHGKRQVPIERIHKDRSKGIVKVNDDQDQDQDDEAVTVEVSGLVGTPPREPSRRPGIRG